MEQWGQILPDGRVFIDYGPTSMVITARQGGKNLPELAQSVFPVIRDGLEEIAGQLTALRQFTGTGSFSHLEGLPRVMAEAALAAGEETLTPMATVAGTVADMAADWIFARGADFVAVNNGGDIALRLGEGQQMKMGILPTLGGKITQIVTLYAEDGIGGVCTSGLGGRSLTRGIADSVTVFAKRCALADACATHIANCSFIDSPRVHTCRAGELEPESDIASLEIVHDVDVLEEREILQGLEQIERETRRQLERGNLICVAADIQGKYSWIPDPSPVRWEIC